MIVPQDFQQGQSVVQDGVEYIVFQSLGDDKLLAVEANADFPAHVIVLKVPQPT